MQLSFLQKLIGCVIMTYLVGVFISGNFDTTTWNAYGKMMLALIALLAAVAWQAVTSIDTGVEKRDTSTTPKTKLRLILGGKRK